jgi:hypothetical protein
MWMITAIQQIEKNLTNLSIDELRHLERIIHSIYRKRDETIIYNDDYGVWAESDQLSTSSQVLDILESNQEK